MDGVGNVLMVSGPQGPKLLTRSASVKGKRPKQKEGLEGANKSPTERLASWKDKAGKLVGKKSKKKDSDNMPAQDNQTEGQENVGDSIPTPNTQEISADDLIVTSVLDPDGVQTSILERIRTVIDEPQLDPESQDQDLTAEEDAPPTLPQDLGGSNRQIITTEDLSELRRQLEDSRHEASELEKDLKIAREDRRHAEERIQRLEEENTQQAEQWQKDIKGYGKIKAKLDQQLVNDRGKIRALEEEVTAWKRDAASLQSHLEVANNKVRDAEENANKLLAETVHLKNKRDEIIKTQKRDRVQLDRLVKELDSKNVHTDPYFFDDFYFKTQFETLRGNIKLWAVNAFSGHAEKNLTALTGSMTQQFEQVNVSFDKYLESDESRPAFAQAFAWRYLLDKIFDSKIWEKSSSAKPYERLLGAYQPVPGGNPVQLALYHEWRSLGAKLAAPQGKEMNVIDTIGRPHTTRIAEQIHGYLAPWCTMGKEQSTSMLLNIAREATKLDLQMQQQKAWFELLGADDMRKETGGIFVPKSMEPPFGKLPSGKGARKMVLLVAPLMVKRGDSEGQNYNLALVIEKAQVELELPKKGRIF